MPREKSLLEKVSAALGEPERVEPGEVVKWDGRRLYVEDQVFMGDRRELMAQR